MRPPDSWLKEWHHGIPAAGLFYLISIFYVAQSTVSFKQENSSLASFHNNTIGWRNYNFSLQSNGDQLYKPKLFHFGKRRNGRARSSKRRSFTKELRFGKAKSYGLVRKGDDSIMFEGKVERTRSESRPFSEFGIETKITELPEAIMSYSWTIKLPVNKSNFIDSELLKDRANVIAEQLGLQNYGPIVGLPGYFYFVHSNFFDRTEHFSGNNHIKMNITEFLNSHPEIEWVKHEPVRMRKKRALEFKDQFFPSQWHLVNLKFVNHDINVTAVWEHNVTGRGVAVAVIDDGVEWTNPDILDNYLAEGSWDLNSNDGDPMPRVDEAGLNHHGTRCAGEIAAVANEYCAVGVAYEAKVSGIRILDGPMTDSLEAMAFNTKMDINDIYSCSWGPDDNGKTVDGPHRLAQAALAHGVMAGRKGYGSIFVVASGNGGHFKDNCNFDGYANSIFTVTVGAVDELGQMPYYAEHCAAMLAVTYSSGQGHQRNIVTTDWRLGGGVGCTDRHTGTSAAAPLAAGMIALMLQVRNCLTWRDIQHIITYTAVKVPIDEEEWQKNGAGFFHSHKHGFGLLNSWKLVTTAKMWESVPVLTSWTSPLIKVDKEIPASGELVEEFRVNKDKVEEVVTLEHVTLTVDLSHPYRGDVMINLLSPSGTVSKLATARKYDRSTDGFNDWTFSTVRCWGERPVGIWRVTILDAANQSKRGRLRHWKITFYGSSMSPREIQQRKRLVREVSSGKYLKEPGPPCLPPPSPVTEKILFSARFLKVLLLLSGFIFLVCTYFVLETVFSNEGKFRTIDLNESDIQAADGLDLKTFLPKELAAQDQIRLNILLEGRTQKQHLLKSPKGFSSALADQSADSEPGIKSSPTAVSILLTPDDLSETKQFEERLKRALEQSRILQTQQMNQIMNLENEISIANKGDGFDLPAEKNDAKQKKPKKLKGILKKPRQLKE
ncbi:proprotein convertase subtilisin/kexin type 7-like [Rhopilema esculentum]|uniref:proprotein convertase subtilisin/kexin type 7-like n=1 Tax=Rhopilema esculentum TaxID=499914 RepID=UPI0031D8D3BE